MKNTGRHAKVRLTFGTLGNRMGTCLLISNSSLYLNCISFDSGYDIWLRAYRNSLISTRKGLGANFEIGLSQNSTFYSHEETPPISSLLAEGNSVAEFSYTSVVIEGGLFDSGSQLICNGCSDSTFGRLTFNLNASGSFLSPDGEIFFGSISSPFNSSIYFNRILCEYIKIESLELGADARIYTPYAIDRPCSFPN